MAANFQPKTISGISGYSIPSSPDGLINLAVDLLQPLVLAVLVIAGVMFILEAAFRGDDVRRARYAILASVYSLIIIGLVNPIKSMLNGMINAGYSGAPAVFQNFAGELVVLGITVLQTLAIYVAVFMVVIAGYQAITSFGRSERLEQARSSFVGLMVALGVVGISEAALSTIFGAKKTGGSALQLTSSNASGIVNIITDFVNVALSLAGVVAVAYVILGAYKVLIARDGDRTAGIKTITHALVGLVIVMLSFALVSIIFNYVNI